MRAFAKALASRGAEVSFLTTTPELIRFMAPFDVHLLCGDPEFYKRDIDVCIIDTKKTIAEHELIYARFSDIRVVYIDNPYVTPDTCDLLVAPVAHWSPSVEQNLHSMFGERFLFGWDYVMLDEEVTGKHPLSYDERDGSIVFCAGGSDPDGSLERIYEFVRADLSGIEKVFLLPQATQGSLWMCYDNSQPGSNVLDNNIHLVPFSRNALRNASLVVGMFGVTAYECLYYRTPMLSIARTPADCDDGRWLSISSGGAMHGCGTMASYTRKAFLDMIQACWKAYEWRSAMHHMSAGLLDGHGVSRVADAIMRL
jgi:spore coat polysaccharide biosynthesis predicted glycosyltransferase SpsG